ncbi:MAG: response regulator [Candidatus Rokuibacteriota bacterium]
MAKVLVVDDSVSVREVLERTLVGHQIEVISAASGDEAIERIEREEPDVVVCDVVMPDKNGYEICEFVKSHPRLGRTPVLLISGIVDDAVRARAAEVRSNDILGKPFAVTDLVSKLESLLPPPAPVVAAHAAAAAGAGPRAILDAFVAIDGVQWAVLADREGFLLESTADAGVDAEAAGALAACLAESSDGLGRELGRGPLNGMILEYDKGLVVLVSVGAAAILAVGFSEPSALGKVRYYARKAVPELLRAV